MRQWILRIIANGNKEEEHDDVEKPAATTRGAGSSKSYHRSCLFVAIMMYLETITLPYKYSCLYSKANYLVVPCEAPKTCSLQTQAD